jgi:thymidylate synthase (FAD)
MNLKYIKKVAEDYPYSYEEPPVCRVELWDFSRANENEESRKETICLVASISYGNKFCKNPNKLWNLLIEKGHESVFEFIRTTPAFNINDTLRLRKQCSPVGSILHKKMVATFKLKVPIFVARQIMRHRTFSYMEMSRRYVKGNKVRFEFWLPQDINPHNEVYGGEVSTEDFFDYFEGVKVAYESLIDGGYKPEQARAFIPLGLYTQFWMQGDYRAWLNFFIHRLHPEAQEETRLVAQSMWGLLKEHQPEIVESMNNYLDEWIQDCNPMFTPARQKKAEWFRKNFLQ